MKLLVVGRGRVGRTLARAWRKAGHHVALAAHDAPRAERASVVVLAVPDRALGAVASHWAARLHAPALVVHTAGALDLVPLEPLRDAGLRVGSLHPLAAISGPEARLAGAFAAVDAAPKDAALLRRLARDAGLRPFRAAVRQRARYHLGAVFAANSQPVLLEAAVGQLRSSGLSDREARSALAALAKTAVDAWAKRGGPEGLTGPVARGDADTIRHHLALLSPGTARELYLALARAALQLAAARRPVPQGLAEVSRALR